MSKWISEASHCVKMRSSWWTSWSLYIRAKLIGRLTASALSRRCREKQHLSKWAASLGLQLTSNSTSNSECLKVMCWNLLRKRYRCFLNYKAIVHTHTHTNTHTDPGRKDSGYRYFFLLGLWGNGREGEKLSGGVIGSMGLWLQSEQQAVDGT